MTGVRVFALAAAAIAVVSVAFPGNAFSIQDAEECGTRLSLARFSFDDPLDRCTSMDAARLVSRLVRDVDFACGTMAPFYSCSATRISATPTSSRAGLRAC